MAQVTGSAESRDAIETAALPQWTFDSTMVFPGDGSLMHAEDGIALPDGRLIVGDQVHGLRLIEPDGSSAPFGDMAAAGYVHSPPEQSGGPNGISLEPGGTHLLVADIFQGRIYRVEVATGAAELVYQHRYGVNTAVRDSQGSDLVHAERAQHPGGGRGTHVGQRGRSRSRRRAASAGIGGR